MFTFLSSVRSPEYPTATSREMLSLRDLDDHVLRDIGIRRTDLFAVPLERLRAACCTGTTRHWAEFVARLRNMLSPKPVPCCQS
jgi:hypothetical protein